MIPAPSPIHEFDDLLDRFIEADLDAAELERFNTMLAQDADLQLRYLEQLAMHAALEWDLTAAPASDLALEPSVPPEPPITASELVSDVAPADGSQTAAPGRATSGGHRPTLPIRAKVLVSLAAGISFTAYMTGILWGIMGGRGGRDAGGEGNEPARRVAVATVTGTHDAEWNVAAGKSAISNQQSAIARSAPLDLTSGSVQLKLKQGVTLHVEGPAQWTIDGDNRATLMHGRLVATVPQQAVGFTLMTPTSKIVDLGTEFGVEVDESGHTDTQVFRGEVRIGGAGVAGGKVASGRELAQGPIVLKAGQAASVGASGKVTLIAPMAASREQFIATAASNREQTFDPNPLSPYAKYAIDETKPVAYWDFSRENHALEIARDRVHEQPFRLFEPWRAGLPGPCTASSFAGFGQQNPALSFLGQQRLQARLIDALALNTEAYSVQVWFAFSDDASKQAVSYLFGRGNARGNSAEGCDAVFVLHSRQSLDPAEAKANAQIKPGTLRFFSGVDGVPSLPRSGKTVLQADRWYLLTLTRDAEQVRIYLDGALEIECRAPWRGGAGEQLDFGKRADLPLQSALNWIGLLDEIAIWNRVLSPDEVAAVYRQATNLTPPPANAE